MTNEVTSHTQLTSLRRSKRVNVLNNVMCTYVTNYILLKNRLVFGKSFPKFFHVQFHYVNNLYKSFSNFCTFSCYSINFIRRIYNLKILTFLLKKTKAIKIYIQFFITLFFRLEILGNFPSKISKDFLIKQVIFKV